ncbi:MAG: hypothetical protein CVT64_05710 [Actinobacteria bacterium HGW-Actinobacteria-4]|nr:MAG: hypothetical protein CVT64_05710 [Actinobacteria bacterium HGW-Actinobacteria-4]
MNDSRVTVAIATVLALALAACSGGGTPDIAPTFSLPAISPLEDPGEDDGHGDFAVTDPYCAIVVQALAETDSAQAMLDNLLVQIATPEVVLGNDMTAIHNAGFDLYAHGEKSLELYADASAHVDEPDIQLALDVMSDFVTYYSIPVAETMATSGTFLDLSDSLSTLTQSATVQGVLAQAPTQQQILTAYTEERCVITIG